MPIASKPPEGGIVAQLGEKSYPLLLRNGEVERFEKMHDVGFYSFINDLINNSAKLHQVRDLIALGLVGAGMGDGEADAVMDRVPLGAAISLRAVARALAFAPFGTEDKKKDTEEHSRKKNLSKATTQAKKS